MNSRMERYNSNYEEDNTTSRDIPSRVQRNNPLTSSWAGTKTLLLLLLGCSFISLTYLLIFSISIVFPVYQTKEEEEDLLTLDDFNTEEKTVIDSETSISCC